MKGKVGDVVEWRVGVTASRPHRRLPRESSPPADALVFRCRGVIVGCRDDGQVLVRRLVEWDGQTFEEYGLELTVEPAEITLPPFLYTVVAEAET